MAEKDDRIRILTIGQNIKDSLVHYGYPFKSKEHSLYVSIYQNSGVTKTITRYLNRGGRYECPEKLKYQFTDDFKIKVSNKCCYKLKKEPAEKWSKENNKPITLTGMRKGEGGLRQTVQSCTIFSDDSCSELKKFHPLLPMEESWIDKFVRENKIELCDLYYSPYNFKRTGCKGCPYSVDLQNQLDVMSDLLLNERKQCEVIWKPIYDEYRRIGYRLKSQLDLFH